MLTRLLLIGLAIWFGVRLLRKFQHSAGIGEQNGRGAPREPERFEPMVRCRRCGVHLPVSAVSSAGLCGKCAD